MQNYNEADIVIIGGGAMGLSTAYFLSKQKDMRIIVIEREAYLGGHTTSRCAGGVRFQFSSALNIEMTKQSINLLKGMQEEGFQLEMDQCGYLFLFEEEQDITAAKQAVELQRAMGVCTEILTGDEAGSLLPMLNMQDVIMGTFCHEDSLVNVQKITDFYVKQCRKQNVEFRLCTELLGVQQYGSKGYKLITSGEAISASKVIITAGPWSHSAGCLFHTEIPVKPVKQQIFVTDAASMLDQSFPVVIYMKEGIGFHREGNGILSEMNRPCRPEDETKEQDMDVDIRWEMEHCITAVKKFPNLSKLHIVNRWAGFYEVTPDGNPVIGSIPGMEGLYCAAGFNGHGFMHNPICGKIMSEIVVGSFKKSLDIREYELKRFISNGRLEKEIFHL